MASPNLDIPALAAAVNNLPALMDDQISILDNALQGGTTIACGAGGTINVLSTTSTRYFYFELTGSPAGAFNIDFPTKKRYLVIENSTGQNATVRVTGTGGASVVINPTGVAVLWIDGTDVKLIGGPNEITNSGLAAIRYACKCAMAANMSVSASTSTCVIFDGTDLLDPDGMHDPSTNPSRMTAQITGYYDIMVWLTSTANVTGGRQSWLAYNSDMAALSSAAMGALYTTNVILAKDSGNEATVDIVANLHAMNVQLNSGDYVEAAIFSPVAFTLDVDQCVASMRLVGT